ncbi:MAG: hypothetical protein CMF62_01925 [Magnetococcales bacterium]|nr:hypothetical protein [Magnetococcales bacterium]|tara:strand:- start:116386 stop:117270 length:885 start_codon:yes stop_codon:yes gene_type:complete
MISVILPVLNGIPDLKRSINSILNQTYKNFELIVINDGSTDETKNYVSSLSLIDNRIILINQTNKGLPYSLNIGLNHATRKYITWTSHDNYYDKTAFEKMKYALDNNLDSDFVYAGHKVFGLTTRKVKGPQNPRDFMFKFRGMACFMWRSSLTNNIGYFDTNLKGIEDFDYWLRILQVNPKFICIDEILYYYQKGNNTMSSKIIDNYKQLRTLLAKKILNTSNFFDINKFYPSIKLCKDQSRAKNVAYLDFSNQILNSSNKVFAIEFKSIAEKFRLKSTIKHFDKEKEELFNLE